MSVTSVANDKDNNEMIPGAVHRSPGIFLKAEGNPGKPQLGDHKMMFSLKVQVHIFLSMEIIEDNILSKISCNLET